MSRHTPIATIDLIRHGATVGGARYRGSRDDPLSLRGWKQMWAAVGNHCCWDCIVSSPLIRCSAFARELAQQCSLPLIIDTRLREIHFGEWEGRTAAELLAIDPDGTARFWNDPLNHAPPGAEPLLRFQARVLAAWDELVRLHAGQHILVVSHGGPTRVILGFLLHMSLQTLLRLDVPHAALNRVWVRVDAQGRRVPRLAFDGSRAWCCALSS